MNVFNLMASITLDTKGYYTALEGADARTKTFASGINKRIDRVKKGLGIGAIAMGTAIAAFGVKSVKTGMQFDKSMSQVAATMGKTVDEMNKETGTATTRFGEFTGNLTDFAKYMGKNTQFSASQASEALNYMALAGYDVQESMDMLPTVLDLASAGNMELATASDMVTDAQTALGLSADETRIMVDQMAATASNSNTSVEQLGNAFLTVGGTAKSLKGGTQELATALGVLADNGIKGSEGGTALRNVMLSFARGKFDKNFKKLGISAYDANGEMRSLQDIFSDMNKAMDGMSTKEKSELIAKTFNARDLKSINALLGTTSDRWNELSETIGGSEGAAGKMAETQLDNLAGDITILKSAFEGLQISVSDKLTPAIRVFVQFLTTLIDHASTLGPIILGLATAFGVFALALNFEGILFGIIRGFLILKSVILTNPIGIMIALVAGLAVALVGLYKNNEKFRNFVNKIWTSIKDRITNIVSIIVAVWQGLNEQLLVATGVWDKIKEVIGNGVNAVKKAFAVFDGFKEKLGEFAISANEKLNKFKDGVSKGIVGAVGILWKARGLISSAFNKIKNVFATVGSAIRSIVLARFNRIKYNITHPIEAAKNTIKNILNKIKAFFPIKVGKIFTGWIPKITLKANKKKDSASTSSKVKEEKFAKAMNQPYMFNTPTYFKAGEAGDEMLYGRKALLDDITEATANNSKGDIYQTNYINVYGAENPEEFATRFVKEMKIKARLA